MRGQSGRIVIEIDPDQKQAIYEALSSEGLTLKSWFLNQADVFLKTRHQLPIDFTLDDESDQ